MLPAKLGGVAKGYTQFYHGRMVMLPYGRAVADFAPYSFLFCYMDVFKMPQCFLVF
jgi:hypothetical protein